VLLPFDTQPISAHVVNGTPAGASLSRDQGLPPRRRFSTPVLRLRRVSRFHPMPAQACRSELRQARRGADHRLALTYDVTIPRWEGEPVKSLRRNIRICGGSFAKAMCVYALPASGAYVVSISLDSAARAGAGLPRSLSRRRTFSKALHVAGACRPGRSISPMIAERLWYGPRSAIARPATSSPQARADRRPDH